MHSGLKRFQRSEAGGENFVVAGNNRIMTTQQLGIPDQQNYEEVQLPFRGFPKQICGVRQNYDRAFIR